MKFSITKDSSSKIGRLEAFTDGVFAIAITLLILDIHVPHVAEGQKLLSFLFADWPTYLAFLIGFFTILICWINHNYMFEFINRCDGGLLLCNGFKLLIVSFTPFATAILSKYIGTSQQQTAVNIYTLNFFLMGTAMSFIWYYAVRNGLTKTNDPALLKAVSRLYIFAPIISGTIFILSFFSISISFILFVIMFLVYVIPQNSARELQKKHGFRYFRFNRQPQLSIAEENKIASVKLDIDE
jgi:uncharacterized membrane protein